MRRGKLRSQLVALVLLPVLAGCEQVKSALREGPDLRWQADSSLLTERPEVLFRLVPADSAGVRIVPIATIGAKGVRELHMGARGWRAFDIEYLHTTSTIVPIRKGRATSGLSVKQGMWEPSPPDTTITCPSPVPFASGTVGDPGVVLATSGTPPPLRFQGELSASELQQAVERIPLLVAPTAGISTSVLERYERRVHQVSSASGAAPSIVVEFDDPEPAPDSIPAFGQRPRQLIVVLDRGVYGYKPNWTYKTVGSRGTLPRLRFLDYVDVNGDGMSELLFGLRDDPRSRYTLILRFETDAWREHIRYLGRLCD